MAISSPRYQKLCKVRGEIPPGEQFMLLFIFFKCWESFVFISTIVFSCILTVRDGAYRSFVISQFVSMSFLDVHFIDF